MYSECSMCIVNVGMCILNVGMCAVNVGMRLVNVCVCVYAFFEYQFCYFLPSVAIALLYVFLFCLLAPLCFNPFFVVPGSVL